MVQGYMRTSEAVTSAGGIWFAFALTLGLYAAIGTIAILVLRAMSRRWREGAPEPEGTPYAPPPPGPTGRNPRDSRGFRPVGGGFEE